MANKFKLDGLLENKIEGETNFKSLEPSQPEDFEHINSELKPKDNHRVQRIQREFKERSLKLHDESIESNNGYVEDKFRELIVVADKILKCSVCEKRMTHHGSMKRHLETHLTGLSYDCNLCGKTFR